MSGMTTFITRYDTSGPGVRLAVKDLIDMAGEPTTAGCRAVASPSRTGRPRTPPASPGAREAGARIVGRTNLHELALGVTGVNQWYGTPVNPLDPTLRPGRLVERLGRRGGHRRGGRGLRQRHRRLGAHPRRLLRHGRPEDDVGPHPARRRLAAGAQLRHRRPDGPRRRPAWSPGMQLLEPGFTVADVGGADLAVGRLPIDADPAITAGARPRPGPRRGGTAGDLSLPGGTTPPCRPASCSSSRRGTPTRMLVAEDPEGIGDDVRDRLELGGAFDDDIVRAAWGSSASWQATLERCFERGRRHRHADADHLPAASGGGRRPLVSRCTLPVNLAGVPALSLPVPTGGPLPASIQLIGPADSEERLLAAGRPMLRTAGRGGLRTPAASGLAADWARPADL